ncbi:M56 family metallopeptidase [Aquimarina algicola]|uniref:M56 family metallopeptidase n=1 Tax=Aquimarina algicola TaxID=2589995 RepID=A0A504J3Y2_9FLAO|nr:M56 family metallopeptidase [Aquimarina algicola]TPN82293.1 M56 family metallopeptidase [Aquimarina algicola]
MEYIFYSSALIGLSYLIYKLFLAKETFYHLNRWILLGLIFLSFTLPFITVPEHLSFRTIFVKESIADTSPQLQTTESILPDTSTVISPDVTSSSPTLSTDSTGPSSLDWKNLILYIYLLGVFVFAVHFIIQLGVLLYRIIKNPIVEFDEYKIIETDKSHAPYSFWNRIFMNPSQYNPDTYLQILKHEQMHIKGKHSLDMLLVELLVMFQWFNPFAWWYRKAIDNNLEYLTDDGMLTHGEDKESYQMNLLRVSTPNMPTGLATNYNQSFLKKRILMMNSKKSTAKSGWKYLIILPILTLTVLSFNPIKHIDTTISEHEGTISNNDESVNTSITNSDFTKGAWDAEVGGGKLCVMFRSSAPLQKSFWSNTRCYEPSLFAKFPKGTKQKMNVTNDVGTMTFIGEFDGKIGDGKYIFEANPAFTNALEKYNLTVEKNDLVLSFLTEFDTNYLAYLEKENISITQENFEDIIRKSLPLDKLKMYQKELTNLGYNAYTIDEICKLNLFDVDLSYINFINKLNTSRASLKEITKAKIHNVTPNYIDIFKNQGYSKISIKEARDLKIHKVTPEFINSFKNIGYSNITLEEAKKLKIHNVTADLIKAYKKAGQKNISLKEAMKLKIHDITPALVKGTNGHSSSSTNHSGKTKSKTEQNPSELIAAFEKLGYKNIDLNEAIALKTHNVTPEFVKKFNAIGYKNIPLKKVIALKVHDITTEMPAEYAKIGYKDLSIEDLLSLKIHDVTPQYITVFKKTKFGDLPLKRIISFKIHDITPEFLKLFEEMGFKNITADQAHGLKIHDVTPEFITSLQKEDPNVSLDQAIKIKMVF